METRTDRHLINGIEWFFRDILLALFFLSLLLALLANPNATKKTLTDKNPGRLTVLLTWPGHQDDDVDLWVEAPGDTPVGYLNRTGKVFDLLHDDRGHTVENTWTNVEFASARTLPEGLYIINSVLYTTWDNKLPVHVHFSVELEAPNGKGGTIIAQGDAFLTHPKDEITLVTFRLNAQHKLIPDSLLYSPPVIPLYEVAP